MTQAQILQDALQRRSARRMAETEKLRQAKQAYIASHPALKSLYDRLVTVKFSRMRAGQGKPAESAEEISAAFERAFAAALAEDGLSADAFEYRPECPYCGDTGMVGEFEQHYCACILNEAGSMMRGLTGIRPDWSFENDDLSLFPDTPLPGRDFSQREEMRRARVKCAAYAEDPAGGNLLLTGRTGLGKTYLLHAIGNRFINAGRAVVLTTAYQLIRAGLDRDSESDPLAVYQDAEILMIDDLGSEPLYKKVTVETLFSVINDRMSRGLPTAISTNLTPADIFDRYGERLASRLLSRSCTKVIQLEGDDVRL